MTLRDELATVIEETYDTIWNGDRGADAVLASPPLQAIRKTLRSIAMPLNPAIQRDLAPVEVLTHIYRLPESVAAWVLGEEQ